MWQAPPKGGAQAAKRRQSKQRIPLHIRRVRINLKIVAPEPAPEGVIAARVLMNDLSLTGAGIFSAAPLEPGQEIELSFENPKDLSLRGRVIWCQEQQLDSHIVSSTPFRYRAGIQFKFKDAEEELRLKKLYEQFAREVLFGMTG